MSGNVAPAQGGPREAGGFPEHTGPVYILNQNHVIYPGR